MGRWCVALACFWGLASVAWRAAGAAAGHEDTVEVYFGCGCFWHVQHGLALLEMSLLGHRGGEVTARAAYAGGTGVGPRGLVCYHNSQGIADYGALGHAEVVSLSLPAGQVGAFAERFWELCPTGARGDPQDVGGEYRSVVGLPGGMGSHLAAALLAKAGSAKLVPGRGNDGDTQGRDEVFVYDTASFPPHTAEKYHQFHNDMVETYGDEYTALQRFASKTQCPGDTGLFSSLFG